jgi:hypothetical protein
MSNYVKATNFYSKDALLTGNPDKIIKGAEIDDEFNAIATAITTKADLNNPNFTGTPTVPTAPAGTNTTQVASTAFVQAIAGNLGTMSEQDSDAVAITGGTIAGTTINGNVVGSNSVGARTVSTSAPSGGSNGDIWYRY